MGPPESALPSEDERDWKTDPPAPPSKPPFPDSGCQGNGSFSSDKTDARPRGRASSVSSGEPASPTQVVCVRVHRRDARAVCVCVQSCELGRLAATGPVPSEGTSSCTLLSVHIFSVWAASAWPLQSYFLPEGPACVSKG